MDNYKERERATQDALLNDLFGSTDLANLLIQRTESLNNMRGDIFRLTIQIAEVKRKLNEWMLVERHDIANELTADGKKLYTNADSRETELLARLAVDAEASALNTQVEALEAEKQALTVLASELSENQRLFRTLIELRIAEMGDVTSRELARLKREKSEDTEAVLGLSAAASR